MMKHKDKAKVAHKLALSYSMTALSIWYLPYLTLPYGVICIKGQC